MNYAVVDLETTGLDPRASKIIEIGCLVVRDGVAMPAESIIVNAGEVPENITGITGITQKDVDGGVRLYEALDWLVERVGSAPILVGHNILAFDWDFLMNAEVEAHYDLPWDISCVRDTAPLFLAQRMKCAPLDDETHLAYARRVMVRRPRFQKYNLVYACNEMGIQIDDIVAHRAAGDVTMTQRLYAALLASPVERPKLTAARL